MHLTELHILSSQDFNKKLQPPFRNFTSNYTPVAHALNMIIRSWKNLIKAGNVAQAALP